MSIRVENNWVDQRRFSSRNRTTRQLAMPENEVFSMAKRPDPGGTGKTTMTTRQQTYQCIFLILLFYLSRSIDRFVHKSFSMSFTKNT